MSNNILEDRKARGGYPLPLLKECFSSGHLMEETRTFGDWLKAKRKLHYLTQEGLADAGELMRTGADWGKPPRLAPKGSGRGG